MPASEPVAGRQCERPKAQSHSEELKITRSALDGVSGMGV